MEVPSLFSALLHTGLLGYVQSLQESVSTYVDAHNRWYRVCLRRDTTQAHRCAYSEGYSEDRMARSCADNMAVYRLMSMAFMPQIHTCKILLLGSELVYTLALLLQQLLSR